MLDRWSRWKWPPQSEHVQVLGSANKNYIINLLVVWCQRLSEHSVKLEFVIDSLFCRGWNWSLQGVTEMITQSANWNHSILSSNYGSKFSCNFSKNTCTLRYKLEDAANFFGIARNCNDRAKSSNWAKTRFNDGVSHTSLMCGRTIRCGSEGK